MHDEIAFVYVIGHKKIHVQIEDLGVSLDTTMCGLAAPDDRDGIAHGDFPPRASLQLADFCLDCLINTGRHLQTTRQRGWATEMWRMDQPGLAGEQS